MKVKMFEGADGWRWHLVGDNGEILSTSEAYASRDSAERTATMVQEAITADEPTEEISDD